MSFAPVLGPRLVALGYSSTFSHEEFPVSSKGFKFMHMPMAIKFLPLVMATEFQIKIYVDWPFDIST